MALRVKGLGWSGVDAWEFLREPGPSAMIPALRNLGCSVQTSQV